jgi:hypothetical protein
MFHRHPGSIGASAYPSRVIKGKKMPGRLGDARVTVRNLIVVQANKEHNLLVVKGSIPGANGGYILIKKALFDPTATPPKPAPSQEKKPEEEKPDAKKSEGEPLEDKGIEESAGEAEATKETVAEDKKTEDNKTEDKKTEDEKTEEVKSEEKK